MCYQPGFQVYYLVEGEDIAGFGSVAVEAVTTPDGTDISRYRNGSPAYTTGFSNTSPDGKYCVFSVAVANNQFGKVDSLAIKGQVTVLLATNREEKTIDLKATEKGEKKIGPFSVQVKSAGNNVPMPVPATITPQPPPITPTSSTPARGNVSLPAIRASSTASPILPPTVDPKAIFTPVRANGATPVPGPPPAITYNPYQGPPPATTYTVPNPYQGPTTSRLPYPIVPSYISDSLVVEITGPLRCLIAAKFMDGDSEIQGPYSWDSKSRRYCLQKPRAGKVTMTMNYWTDLKEVKLPFGQ
jgi:hypothetical protein